MAEISTQSSCNILLKHFYFPFGKQYIPLYINQDFLFSKHNYCLFLYTLPMCQKWTSNQLLCLKNIIWVAKMYKMSVIWHENNTLCCVVIYKHFQLLFCDVLFALKKISGTREIKFNTHFIHYLIDELSNLYKIKSIFKHNLSV